MTTGTDGQIGSVQTIACNSGYTLFDNNVDMKTDEKAYTCSSTDNGQLVPNTVKCKGGSKRSKLVFIFERKNCNVIKQLNFLRTVKFIFYTLTDK